MQEESRVPKTARDALLIELLGDLGLIHDQIKALPEDIQKATEASLEILAKSVEAAEETAVTLAETIEQKKEVVISELKLSVRQTLNEHAATVFSELENNVNNLQSRISAFELADPKSRRLNLILSCALVVTLILSSSAIFAVYSAAKSTINNLVISTQQASSSK